MKSITKSLKDIGFLTIALTLIYPFAVTTEAEKQ
jgi:hypothetical protein